MSTLKIIKRPLLSLLILSGLVGCPLRLQAAVSAAQPHAPASYGYTLQHHPDQVSPIEEKVYLDIAEILQELTCITQAASKARNDAPQLLAMVAENLQNRQYYKYLFASNGLLVNSAAQQKAHQLNYHLIKAPAGPVIWQVLSFLGQQSALEIKALTLPKDAPLCLSCGHMCWHLFGKKLPVHKAGCQRQPFPITAAPASAIACFYSDRFTDQQRKLALEKVGDKAFPNPKKTVNSPPSHHRHTRIPQLLMQSEDPVQLTDDMASCHIEDDQKEVPNAAEKDHLPPDQLLVPANGHCLYTTIIMGYLLPVSQEADKLTTRMDQLFGHQPADYLNRLAQTLQNPTDYLSYLHSKAFRVLVSAFLSRMQIKEGTWGGPQEIQTIANKLKVRIQAYYPDPSNRAHLVQSDLTQPAQANGDITIHIVRDRVHPAEVLTQAEKASAGDNRHYQHYRLKYTLPLPISDYSHDDAKEEYKEEATNEAPNAHTLPIPRSLREMAIFPTPYEYVRLSNDVYFDDVVVGSQVDQLDDWLVCGEISLEEDNRLSRPFKALGFSYFYKGRLYKHRYKKQMVLAHRGTDLKNLGALKISITSIVQNDIGRQDRLTLDWVAQALAKVAQEGMCSLSFTGHSLGGWLAQLSLFVFWYQKETFQTQYPNMYDKLYVKAVTFDTPGARAMLTQMNRGDDPLTIDHLDITNYLSEPNLVNCCNAHVGSLYRVVFKAFPKWSEAYTLESHKIESFIEAFDPQTKDAKRCLFIRRWPKLNLGHLRSRLANFITSSKSKSILDGLRLLKDFAQGGVLGKDYKKFLKSAQQTTTMHIAPKNLTNKAIFDLAYEFHYNVMQPDYARFHRRHIPEPIYRLLHDVLPTNQPDFYGLKKVSRDDIFTLAEGHDSRLFLDTLMQKGPEWLAEIQRSMSPPQMVAIQTSVEAAPLVDIPRKSRLPELPHPEEFIVKRAAQLKDLYDTFQVKPIQVITGDAGTGKSTLARLYADVYFAPKGKSYYAHVWWFHAQDKDVLRESIAQICRMMEITSNDKHYLAIAMQNIQAGLQAANARWLLVFDHVQQPQDISDYFRKPIQGGHILITSRHTSASSWEAQLGKRCTVTPAACLARDEAIDLLHRHHIPRDDHEKTAQQDLLALLKDFYPLALSQIGHYIRRDAKAHAEKQPYQKYRDKYHTGDQLIGDLADQEHWESNLYHPSILVTFHTTLDKIKEALKQAHQLEETFRILHVMALLHPDGLDWCFLPYLLRARRGDYFKTWFQDRAQSIKEVKAKKSVACLRAYGLLLDQGVKCRIHRTIQAIMRAKLKNHKNKARLTYIEEQALALLESIQQQMQTSTHVIIDELRFTIAAHCRALMWHIQYDAKKRTRLLRLMSQIDTLTYLKDQDLYLPPQASHLGDLHEQVEKFINTTNASFSPKKKFLSLASYTPLLLIQGDTGTGKSTYATYLAAQLWKIYHQAMLWAHIPLFISLPEFCPAGEIPTNIIEAALAEKGMKEAVVQQIKDKASSGKQPWVFIFDGYDEIHGKQNLFTHCHLKVWGISYSKYIITCRTNYLTALGASSKKDYFLDHNGQPAEVLTIAPYAKDTIKDYINKFAHSSYNRYRQPSNKKEALAEVKEVWNAKRYQKALKARPALEAWMTTPLLLVVGLQLLPRIAAAEKDLSTTNLYEAFVEEWLDREKNKPPHKIDKEALRTFCEKLAYTLWQADSPTLKQADKTMTSFFENTHTLQSAPLRYLGDDRYMFIHIDFQHFFAASFILKNIQKERMAFKASHFDKRMRAFLLHHKDQLWHYIRQAQQRSLSTVAASNSVQILCCAGHRDFTKENLTSLDLRNLALPGINFSKAKLPKDLSGVKFTHAQLPKDHSKHHLTHTNLSHTNLTNVQLPKDLSGVNFTHAQLPKDLSKHYLTHANLSHTNLTNVQLPKDLSGVHFTHAQLPKDLSKHDLTHANLSNTNLIHVKLPENLSGVNFTDAQLPKDLSKHGLPHANLMGKHFTANQSD